jgi:hypothetical protein
MGIKERAAASSPLGGAIASVLWELVGREAREWGTEQVLKELNASSPPRLGYAWGGTGWGPDTGYLTSSGRVDCSGFASALLQRVGVLKLGVRHTTKTVASFCALVPKGTERAGDLRLYGSGSPSHVGVVLIPGEMLLESHGEGSSSTNNGRVGPVKWTGRSDVLGYYRPPDPRREHLHWLADWRAALQGEPLTRELKEASWRQP